MTVICGPSATNTKKVTPEEQEKLRKTANRMVKGVFRCHEPRGGSVELVWRGFKGDPIRKWTFWDGREYEIPVGLAKHLNKNCSYHKHSHILGPNGEPMVDREGETISRMNFESLELY